MENIINLLAIITVLTSSCNGTIYDTQNIIADNFPTTSIQAMPNPDIVNGNLSTENPWENTVIFPSKST